MICGKCHEDKPDALFPHERGKRHGRTCKACMAANSRRHHALNKGTEAYSRTRRATLLATRYGMTLDDERGLYAQQQGACPICNSALLQGKWHVDHCHSTGKIRGLLCGPCNRALGYFKEDTTSMNNAILYVEQHRG